MILTIALLFMCIANVGIIILFRPIFSVLDCVHDRVHATGDDLDTHDEASRKRQAELIGYMERSIKLVGEHVVDNAVDEAKFIAGLKVQVASVRHDMAIDQLAINDRFDGLEKLIAEDGKKTRKDQQEIKTRLADEESDDQKAKRKARSKKLSASK